jgi:hypothetical protein
MGSTMGCFIRVIATLRKVVDPSIPVVARPVAYISYALWIESHFMGHAESGTDVLDTIEASLVASVYGSL